MPGPSKMFIEKIGHTVVAYSTAGVVQDVDCERLIEAAHSGGVEWLYCYMEGRTDMTPVQRDRTRSQLIKFKTIGITDNAFVRGIGQMIKWFGGTINMYHPDKYKDAARELCMNPIDTSKVILFIDRSRRACGFQVAS